MRAYFKVFSFKEVISAFVSSIFDLSICFFIFQLNSTNSNFFLTVIASCLTLFISHRFYFLENGKRNRFFGRIFHDLMIVKFSSFMCIFFMKISETYYIVGFVSNYIILFTFIFLTAELILTILNKILIRISWHVW